MDTIITPWADIVGFPILTIVTIVPILTAGIILILPSSAMAMRIGFAGALITLLLAIYIVSVFDINLPGVQLYEQLQNIIFTYTVGVDGTNILFIPLTALLAIVVLVYMLTTRRANDRIQISSLLAYEGILMGAFVSMNALQFWFWCFMELIPVVIMTLRAGSGNNRRWVVALLLQHWGSGLLMSLIGFLLLAFGVMGSGDTLSFDWLILKDTKIILEYGTLIFFLLFFGFAIRMPLFPFHGWLPIVAEQGTIASGAIFLMSIKVGIYAAIRFIVPIIPTVAERWSWFVLLLGLISIFYGALLALMQINIRRLIAFAVLSHTGMLVIGVFNFNLHGQEGSILLSTTAYGLATAGLILCVGMIYKRTHTAYIPRLGGMFEVSYAIAFLFAICALSTMVMPGTPGFDGAHLLLEGTIMKHGWLVSIAIMIGNVFTAGLLLRAFQQIFISTPKRNLNPSSCLPHSNDTKPPSRRNETVVAIVICMFLVGIGFNTTPWIHMIDQNADVFDGLSAPAHHTGSVEPLMKDN